MPIKIKSRVSQLTPSTPLRHPLRSLSQQRDLRKISKQKSNSFEAEPTDLLQSLTHLEKQAEVLASQPQPRNPNLSAVPRTTITLKPKKQLSTMSFSSNSEKSMRIISIGSICCDKKPKKKGIEISLRSRRSNF